ncbi:MAG: SDR family NAD(P)-dependent oxidoreductase [Thermoleophilaceae bacterium]
MRSPVAGSSPHTGRVAIVTGASRGLGAGLAARFRRSGYAVVATSRSIASVHDADFVTVQGDIAEAETAERVVERALERFGRIDSLVNNAGVYSGKPFLDYTQADYDALTSVNLTGFFHMTQWAIRQMAGHGGGHVVNISANLVDDPGSEPPAALSALTKGGVAAVTRALATEFASQGVRVNAVAPGPIRTQDAADSVIDAVLYLERAAHVSGEILHVAAP